MINLSFNIDNIKFNLKGSICNNKDLIKYLDFDHFTGLCKSGCPHYNMSWSCPPNSPSFDKFSQNYKYSLVLTLCCDLKNDDSLENIHQKLRDTISPILTSLEKDFNGLKTDGGRCKLCKSCTYINNKECIYPDKLRYSMEAMGINLDMLCREVLNHSISWNKKDNSPKYCTALGSILFNKDISEEDFDKYIKNLVHVI